MVPTTAGTGAEVTPNAIVTLPDQELKVGVVSDRLYPRLAVLDPELTLSLPQEATAATGMDAFTHALESYLGKKANPISDMYALESIRLISGSLVRSYEDGQSLSARSSMLYGSAFGGMALAAAGTAAVHAMAYPLGGRFGIAHGTANAMLLPHVLEAQLDEVRGRLEAAAAAMRQGLSGAGEDGIPIKPGADWALEQMADWVKRLGIPQDLTAWGVKAADLPDLAEAASKVTRLIDNNPKAFTVGELQQIYRRLMPVKNV
ncbi:iron-containing alcohol dehydrogenase [Paenibacillus sp. CC-CFT747]|nr:iron-containing alcohol dehydrogenase [Paenibacillus sp. CC-CFT747]